MTEFWNTKDIRPDGTYYKCDVCGEWHKFDFGSVFAENDELNAELLGSFQFGTEAFDVRL